MHRFLKDINLSAWAFSTPENCLEIQGVKNFINYHSNLTVVIRDKRCCRLNKTQCCDQAIGR